MAWRQAEVVGHEGADDAHDRRVVLRAARVKHTVQILVFVVGRLEIEREQFRDVVAGEAVLGREVLVVDDLAEVAVSERLYLVVRRARRRPFSTWQTR